MNDTAHGSQRRCVATSLCTPKPYSHALSQSPNIKHLQLEYIPSRFIAHRSLVIAHRSSRSRRRPSRFIFAPADYSYRSHLFLAFRFFRWLRSLSLLARRPLSLFRFSLLAFRFLHPTKVVLSRQYSHVSSLSSLYILFITVLTHDVMTDSRLPPRPLT